MIIRDGVKEYVGQVIGTHEHYWLDGMTEVYADIWNLETHRVDSITIGYYGCDCRNLCGDVRVTVDASPSVKRDILRTLKEHAVTDFCNSVTEYKTGIRKGTHAEVIRGKKISKGTKLEVFWVGDRPTYRSQCYHWMHETERIAGCYDENGNKVWIKVEYLKSLDPIKSPCAAERRKFIKAYVIREAKNYGINLRK